jgi:predicted dehydrogenase
VTRPLERDRPRLALIGGGRWARVLGGVLLEIAPDARIWAYTPGNAAAMREWSRDSCSGQIEVFESLPDFRHEGLDAAIVANAARDHARMACEFLGAGIATLVEKPLALSQADAMEMTALAERNNVLMAASRVPLFARYIDAFALALAGTRGLREVRLAWTDPRAETRYGEAKQYDPGVTLFVDMLPHVLPILRRLFGRPMAFIDIAMADGGMRAEIRGRIGDVPCTLSLARNASGRRRIVDVETASGALRLDFSREPGRIIAGGVEQDGDPAWNLQPRPLALMLRSFLTCVVEGGRDERLSAASAVEDCGVADQALAIYDALQAEWLAARLGHPLDDGIRYAVSELLAAHDRETSLADDVVAPIWGLLSELGAIAVRDMLGPPDRRVEAVRMLLARAG